MPDFVKGQSGNPKGRPKSYKGCQKLRDLIGIHAEKIVKKLILSAVNGGDVQAAKLLIERALPAFKPIEMPVELAIPVDGNLADQGRAIIAALSNGDLAPQQAGQILTALANVAKLIELSEFEKRLLALEGLAPEQAEYRPSVVYVDESIDGEPLP